MKFIFATGIFVTVMTFVHCLYCRICGICSKKQYRWAKFGIAFLVAGMLAFWFGIDCPFDSLFSSWENMKIWLTLSGCYITIGLLLICRYYISQNEER